MENNTRILTRLEGGKAVCKLALLALLAVSLAACSSMKQMWGLKGIVVSSNDQVYTGKTADVLMDIKGGNLLFEFTATSDPVDNGYPVNVKSADTSIANVVKSTSDPSRFTIKGAKSGYTTVTVSCSIYTFDFIVYVADSSRSVTVAKLKEQREADLAREAAAAVGTSLSGKIYKEDFGYDEYYGIIFTNAKDCVSVTHLEPPYAFRPGSYTIDAKNKKVIVNYTGKAYFDEKLTKEFPEESISPYTETYSASDDFSILEDSNGYHEYELQ